MKLNVESLEERRVLSGVSVNVSDHEQLLLELVNRARQDPLAEVARHPTVNSLNAGLNSGTGTISSTPKQPLVAVQPLVDAAGLHSLDMLNSDFFSHQNPQGQSPSERAAVQGYPNPVGENIAWNGSTAAVNQTLQVIQAHQDLFASPLHRLNMTVPGYNEAGLGVRFGAFSVQGVTYTNTAMVTENFAFRTTNPYITGVVYQDDVVDDDFYSIGEGIGDWRVSAVNLQTGDTYSTVTGPSGGYAVEVPAGTYTVVAVGAQLPSAVTVADVAVANENVKIDFDLATAQTSADDIVGRSSADFWVAESNGVSVSAKFYGDWSEDATWSDVNVADVNGDGLDDVVGRAAGTWWVALATGKSYFITKAWGTWSTATNWTDVRIGDFNGDHFADIVGRAADGSLWLARSTGNSFVTESWGLGASGNLLDVGVGDFNGDGIDDLAGRANDGSWWIAASRGDRFENLYYGKWSANVNWRDVRVGDFNGDGLDDIAGRTESGQWWVSRASGADFFFVEYWGSWYNGVSWQDVVVADFDSDGDDDIAGRANGEWWLAKSNGSRFTNQHWGAWSNGVSWLDVAVADINNDGTDDIVGRANGQWWAAQSSGQQFVSRFLGKWSNNVTWTDVAVGNFV